MLKNVSLEWKSLGVMLFLTFAINFAGIKKVNVDRAQENVYLGVPYCMLLSETTRVGQSDPFAQNGAITVIPAAWIYLKTGKLSRVRLYYSLFTLAALLLTHLLIKQVIHQLRLPLPNRRWPFIHLAMLVTWICIPILFPYSVQTNGMVAGLCAYLGAFLVYPRKRYVAYALFGLAAHLKGQFVGLSLGLIAFVAIEAYLVEGSRRQGRLVSAAGLFAAIKEICCFVVAFLAAPFLVTLLVYLPLGWIKSPTHFVESAFLIPKILAEEIGPVILRILGLEKAKVGITAEVIRQRQRENFGPWGIWVKFLVASSIGFSLIGIVATVTPWLRRLRGVPLRAIGFCGLLYWVNFLYFYAFPYWYNVLPMLWFSILFFPISLLALLERVRFPYAGLAIAGMLMALGGWYLPKHTQIFSPGSGSSIVHYPFFLRACNEH